MTSFVSDIFYGTVDYGISALTFVFTLDKYERLIYSIYLLGFAGVIPSVISYNYGDKHILTYLMLLSNFAGFFLAGIVHSKGYHIDYALLLLVTTFRCSHQLVSFLVKHHHSYRGDKYVELYRQIKTYSQCLLFARLIYILKVYNVVFTDHEVVLGCIGLGLMIYTELVLYHPVNLWWLKWSPDLFHIHTHILNRLHVTLSPSDPHKQFILYTVCHSLHVIVVYAVIGYLYAHL